MKSKVVKIYEQGPVSVLKIEESDIKSLNPDEVLIEHSYVGLNFIDINQRNGAYPLKTIPSIMGMEGAGIIVEIGSNVDKFNVGENNGIGEAALLVINDFGEENIPGLFVSEPMRKGHVRKFRKGFNTTHSTKITACSRLKTMIENDKMVIHSKPLISELKGFVATGSSYQAKSGMGDDLVSATLLAIRMMSVLKDWDPRVYSTFNQAEDIEDYEPPMPIFISSNY